jgi:hypothetical protein
MPNEKDALMSDTSMSSKRIYDESAKVQKFRRAADMDFSFKKPSNTTLGFLILKLQLGLDLFWWSLLLLSISLKAFNLAILFPGDTEDFNLITNINEPFTTGVKHRDQSLGETKETPSPTSGPRFTNKWKEVSNGFELVFTCDAKCNSLTCITAGELISNQKDLLTYIAISGIPNLRPTDMPARILPLLVFALILSNMVQLCYGSLLSATQARQHDNLRQASQSHVLEPYFHPEITEVGTLPSLGALRAACVENILIFYNLLDLLGPDGVFSLLQDFNFWKEAPNTHSSLHQARKKCSCQVFITCLMPDTVNLSLLTRSLRYLETLRH